MRVSRANKKLQKLSLGVLQTGSNVEPRSTLYQMLVHTPAFWVSLVAQCASAIVIHEHTRVCLQCPESSKQNLTEHRCPIVINGKQKCGIIFSPQSVDTENETTETKHQNEMPRFIHIEKLLRIEQPEAAL